MFQRKIEEALNFIRQQNSFTIAVWQGQAKGKVQAPSSASKATRPVM